jgi:hypothetical protein
VGHPPVRINPRRVPDAQVQNGRYEPAREKEYNDWYQNTHLNEMVALPGFRSARRFRFARSLVEGEVHPYLAEYEIETDDIDAVLDGLRSAALGKILTISDAIDRANTHAVVYEVFGDDVVAL